MTNISGVYSKLDAALLLLEERFSHGVLAELEAGDAVQVATWRDSLVERPRPSQCVLLIEHIELLAERYGDFMNAHDKIFVSNVLRAANDLVCMAADSVRQ